ncbi:MAG: inositol monophosphatase [Deltaproteobacteria bacterium]|nr:inositol monophosphatase [Deltaproteobacteria bacterium]
MWEKEMAIAHQAAQEAGKALLDLLGKNTAITKKGHIDLVTEADVRSERIILDFITRLFPQDSILTEEAGEYRHRPDRVWILDPLDGTTNFAHQFPFFAVSIALEIEKEVALGVVFNPLCRECFHAIMGGGAFLNGTPISVSQTRTLQDSLLGTGFPYDIHQEPDRVLENFRRFVVRAQGVRRPGSAALDLCYVAAGRLDGFWEEGLKPWDTAAGVLIVKEAGGMLSTYEGRPYSPYEKSIIASNPFIHGLMVEALAT